MLALSVDLGVNTDDQDTFFKSTMYYLNWDTVEDEWRTSNRFFEKNNHRNQGMQANMMYNQLNVEFIESVCPARDCTCVPFTYP